ncbi:MAG: hypothetical protein Q4B26_21010, partial [Eubacteriales bacterium]|nr:hypothetical protein [Eubacteriales bacterium]
MKKENAFSEMHARVFPLITSKRQKLYEEMAEMAVLDEVIPEICGNHGRACRQMGDHADKALCARCSLNIFCKAGEIIEKKRTELEYHKIYTFVPEDVEDIAHRLMMYETMDPEQAQQYVTSIIKHLYEPYSYALDARHQRYKIDLIDLDPELSRDGELLYGVQEDVDHLMHITANGVVIGVLSVDERYEHNGIE